MAPGRAGAAALLRKAGGGRRGDAADPRAGELAPGGGTAETGGGRARARLVDLDEVELELRADRAGVVGDVEELGLAGLQADRLARLRIGAAVAVAERGDVLLDEEDRAAA